MATLKHGERLYRDGLLPSGKPLIGIIKGDLPAPGNSFTCISCHMRSGLGSVEGSVLTTPTNGRSLYAPRANPPTLRPGMSTMGASSKGAPSPQPPPARPAYTDETLAAALRGGIDPSGRAWDPVMPRYKLQDDEMAILISYLKSLSSEFSPGVDATTLRFATVITDDLTPDRYQDHLNLLDDFIRRTNERTNHIENEIRNPRVKRQMMVSGRVAYRKLSLSRWLLKGAPETWRSQLAEYYRKEPVFALIGGISGTAWKPVHDFCESNRLPCLYPQTDFPVISETDWYTLYPSKGYYQEGETAAHFLNRGDDFPDCGKVLVITRESSVGKMLSDGFRDTWRALGHTEPINVLIAEQEPLTPDRLALLVKKEKPVALVIWDSATLINAINALPAQEFKPPGKIIVSSGYLGKKIMEMNDNIRDNVYITYPERLPADEKLREAYFFGAQPKGLKKGDSIGKSTKLTYPLIKVLELALREMKENFYRDYLLDIISMGKDLDVPLYERMSFGPGQRYASMVCYIVKVGNGSHPELVKTSDWVIH
ncbi:MAG: ABC transporter substrate-binding protein [Pseudomonadota bacterium]